MRGHRVKRHTSERLTKLDENFCQILVFFYCRPGDAQCHPSQIGPISAYQGIVAEQIELAGNSVAMVN
jgi:hypothetical protein